MPKELHADYLDYSQTGYFKKIIVEYLSSDINLKEFYAYSPNIKGINAAIEKRKLHPVDRQLLADELMKQYGEINDAENVKDNIRLLTDENTFTICTAHQPNIFTGHLYFIYKIFHIIKLAGELKEKLPAYNFVPVFFMGSEDADLEELNHVFVDGKKYSWETKQSGAVGRMKVDDNLIHLINEIAGRLEVEKHGAALVNDLKECYTKGLSIEQATFLFVHRLFSSYGLVIFLPDNSAFKKPLISIFEDDLLNNTSSEIVEKTSEKLSAHYKVQAHPREINLFYLRNGIRNRIIEKNKTYYINDTDESFTRHEIINELQQHPERFSPNVILRGLMQELLLPDIAFIGGGGELSYWLELKDLFTHYNVSFPVLMLRNSFLIIENKFLKLLDQLDLSTTDLFSTPDKLLSGITKKESSNPLELNGEIAVIKKTYLKIRDTVSQIDPTLAEHTSALESQALRRLSALEKKMLRAEKRKFSEKEKQIQKLREHLFPGEGLQERSESFLLFYAKWGKDLFETIHKYSLPIEAKFSVLKER
jgi:bacillithiol biosynthesis cysteine-adding enzyme BshC